MPNSSRITTGQDQLYTDSHTQTNWARNATLRRILLTLQVITEILRNSEWKHESQCEFRWRMRHFWSPNNAIQNFLISSSIMSAVKLLSRVRLFVTPWTVAYQAPPSMGISRQEYWSGLPFPSPGDLPNSGTEPGSPTFQADALTSEPPGKPSSSINVSNVTLSTRLFYKSLQSWAPCSLFFQGHCQQSPLQCHPQKFFLGRFSWTCHMPIFSRKWPLSGWE